jgi:8-oxo-dGTP diphosphatase
MISNRKFAKLADVNWDRWTPTERATLLFVIRDDCILLIHKKKGLGAGKINGPGGRIEPGEKPEQAAVREVQEELLVTPTGVEKAGELMFQFVDGFSIHGYVFTARECEGVPQETSEATPMWVPLQKIPYDRMWADDRIWIPWMLAGKKFLGRFIFDNDTMLDSEIMPWPANAGSV